MLTFTFHTYRFLPQTALLSSWCVWLLCFAFLPISPIFFGSVDSVLLLVVSNLALWLGLSAFSLFGKDLRSEGTEHFQIAPKTLHFALIIMIAAAFVACGARVIDYFVIRGINLSGGYEDIRTRLTLAGPNFFSALYAALSGVATAGGILALVIFVQRKHELFSGARKIVLVLAAFFLIENPTFSLLVGSRSYLFLTLAMVLIAMALALPRLSARHVLVASIALFVVFLLTMVIFLSRLGADAMHLDVVAKQSGYTQLVPLSDGVLIAIRDSDPITGKLLFYVMSVGQYVVHGVFEFFLLLKEKQSIDPFLLGRYEFFIFDKVQQTFSGHITDLEQYNPRSGRFTTFWGPAYIDFGYFTVVYAFISGVIIEFFRREVQKGDLFAFPSYVLFLVQIVLVPVTNGIQAAAALYLNIGFFALWLISRLARRNFGPLPVVDVMRNAHETVG